MKKETYRPLPKGLTIKPSPIEGLGLFTNRAIGMGEHLGLTHIFLGTMTIRTPLGGFINHSENPNCELRDSVEFRGGPVKPNKDLWVLGKDIKQGEELTIKYTMYDPIKENE